MQTENSGGAVQIGEWLVDPALDTISRGTETQKLEPRMMRLLLCLADSAGAVVSVDRLLTEVWSGVVVGSASVYQAVSQLRKLLGDVDPNPTYIATVPRKGYRLVAQVVPVRTHQVAASATPPAARAPTQGKLERWRRAGWAAAIAAAVLAAAALAYALIRSAPPARVAASSTASPASAVAVIAPQDKSIAVLPFVDMSEKKDQEYFSDGLSEELINHLSRSPGLKVIARTSSFQFKGRNEDARSIAVRLGVAHLLEGSVRKAGQELRVNTQLIRASDGVQLWSQTYDRNLADIFKVQDEISDRVAKALHRDSRYHGPRSGRKPM